MPRPIHPRLPGSGTGVTAHTLRGEALFRGIGAPTRKSAALLPVSVQPPPTRNAAVVLLSDGVVAVSKKLALP